MSLSKLSWKKKFKTTPYQRGYNFECRVRKHLESQGYVVFRHGYSAFPDLHASKKTTHSGTIDLQEPCSETLFVECRVRGNISLKERFELIKMAYQAGAKPMLAYRKKRLIVMKRLREEKIN